MSHITTVAHHSSHNQASNNLIELGVDHCVDLVGMLDILVYFANSNRETNKYNITMLENRHVNSGRKATRHACTPPKPDSSDKEQGDARLFFKMIETEDARLFLTVRGCLTTICKLITQEVSNVESLERSLHIDISQGFILHKLIELLREFLDIPNIRSRFMREQLLSEVLEALIVIKGLIVQKTKLISDCSRLLKDLLDSLLLENAENKKHLIQACIGGLWIHWEKRGRMPRVHTLRNKMELWNVNTCTYLRRLERSKLRPIFPLNFKVNAFLPPHTSLTDYPPNLHKTTPYELLYGEKPSYDHMRVLGCMAYYRSVKTKGDKFEIKRRPRVLIGYPSGTKGYKIYDPSHDKIVISRDVQFAEKMFPYTTKDKRDKHEEDMFSYQQSEKMHLDDDVHSSRQNQRQGHWDASMRILRNLKATPRQGIFFPKGGGGNLVTFCDADWLGVQSQEDLKLDTSYSWGKLMSLGNQRNNLSSHDQQNGPTALHRDNQAARHIANNLVFHERTKHIEIDCYFVKERVESHEIEPFHVDTKMQIADLLTKALGSKQLEFQLVKLGMRNLHAPP
nr:auxin transport protein BIG [Tanacetum cinerariifolium]